MLLAGVILKYSVLGFTRFLVAAPDGLAALTPLVATVCVVSMLHSTVMVMRQSDAKRAVAFASIGHMNLIYLALLAQGVTTTAIVAALHMAVCHGLVSPLMFLLVGTVGDIFGTRHMAYLRGLWHVMPVLGLILLAGLLSNAGIPGNAAFVPEFLMFVGLLGGEAQTKVVWIVILALTYLLVGVYTLWIIGRLLIGTPSYGQVLRGSDVPARLLLPMIGLLDLILVAGTVGADMPMAWYES